ncbi:MAG: PDZ domain-containing protein [Acidobacteriota bacterium]
MGKKYLSLCALLSAVLCSTAYPQVDARLLREPDVSATQITFVYAGDIWVVSKGGGIAHRLSSPPGEESFPRFSPDGTRIAFSGNYDGNTDVYVVPATGGLPQRVTHHPAPDRLLDWYPDGNSLLYGSPMSSGRQRFNQMYKVPRQGGLPERLPIPYGEFGTLSPDGKTLAYMPKSRDFRTWKRYRGGWAPDIWLYDLTRNTARNLTHNPANDSQPMWHRNTLYFLSDRGPHQRHNLWAYDLKRDRVRQLTRFEDFDIHFPAIGPSDIVFEAGGRLYLFGLSSKKTREVGVQVVADRATLKPRNENVSKLIRNAWISPTGKRALFEARGEVFTVPAEHGVIRNLTHSPGVAERNPTWSPDKKEIAYWSDRSGEYALTVRAVDGSGEEKTLATLGKGFRYRPYWSPDSKKLAFVDDAMRIYIHDLDSGKTAQVDKGFWMYQGALNNFRVSWSSDSRWMAYSRGLENPQSALFLYDTREAQRHQVTSGYYNDTQPTFDPDGKYLYFLTNRTLKPSYSDIDNSWVYANTTNIAAVSLRSDVPSPLAPRNDEEKLKEEEEKEKDKKEGEKKGEGQEQESGTESEKAKPGKKTKEIKPVEIDLTDFERRVVVLPPPAGNYTGLQAASGKAIYRRLPRTGAAPKSPSPLLYYDLKKRKEETVLKDVGRFWLSADGKKVLASKDSSFAIVNLKPKQKLEKKLPTKELEARVDPRAEWRQIFNDSWRFVRDYFYDPNMHGVDWQAMRERYGHLLEGAVTRWDVNFVIGELIGELNSSHTYRRGGDTESARRQGVGLLGIDWALENGAYRIKRIVRGAPWDSEVRSPLDQPGLSVKEGDYILRVNGVPLETSKDPWAAFEGLAKQTVALTVNDQPAMEGAREVLVKTLASESRLRHLEWIESNRRRVEEASQGRVGYIYVRSTGIDGQTELMRQFAAQFQKDGLIIDERFNSGGQIPDRFIELLDRPPLSFWAVRNGRDWQWPPVANFGPKVMLINGWSGSGGDAFPYYFREAGLGPLIGSRTWGGLIGISGAPRLIDGGVVTVPTFRMYSSRGQWFQEGHGVDPDIEVPENPAALAKGRDTQLERAIQEVLERLEKNPPVRPHRPGYERRVPPVDG